MDADRSTRPHAKRRAVTLGPELERRLEAARDARHPKPPYAALVRAAVSAGLAVLEAPRASTPPEAA